MTDFDVVVIGGGVVGCAVVRRLALAGGQSLALLEQADNLITGASSANSGIFHTVCCSQWRVDIRELIGL